MKTIKKQVTECKKALIRLLDDCIALADLNIIEAKRMKKKYYAQKKQLEREVGKDVAEYD